MFWIGVCRVRGDGRFRRDYDRLSSKTLSHLSDIYTTAYVISDRRTPVTREL